ncbi:MAG: energy transducer TonB [Verrucomicrobia bacterium]|nr:energy transducer TonB [Verrucomicrobiota bacterium]
MNPKRPATPLVTLAAGLCLGLATSGCQSTTTTETYVGRPSGSLGDLNYKLNKEPAPVKTPRPTPDRPQVVLLVMHDAEGVPVYAETQKSSGDPALDRRAQDWILKKRRFPKGVANTVVVTVDPKQVPKP